MAKNHKPSLEFLNGEPERYHLLRVTTDYYCAGAVWVKRSGVWAATQTAPILNWMRFKTPAEVHLELLRLGAKWEWMAVEDGKAETQTLMAV